MLDGKVLSSRLRGFVNALSSDFGADTTAWTEYVAMTVSQVSPEAWSDEQRVSFSSALRELGGAFRRLEALNYERMAEAGNGFDAVRLTVTKPDGSEVARLVRVDSYARQDVEQLAEDLLERTARILGSRAIARDSLLALLAEERPSDGGLAATPDEQRETS
jgi:hypothetical protein